ncbi:MAG: hypothetical protein ACM3IL_03860, partial [Deltaproteobacteria bacterium]
TIADLLHRKWAKALIIILSTLQFVGTTLYVREKRQIPAGIKEGFDYLKKNTPPDSLIIYPETVILEGANRRFGWAGRLQPALYNLFWNKDDAEVKKILKDSKIDYIAIKKSRFYDDTKVHHYGGYPKSFLERLPKSPNVKLIFDNKEMSIWQVK